MADVRRILTWLCLGVCLAAAQPGVIPSASAQEGLLQAPGAAKPPAAAAPAPQSVEAQGRSRRGRGRSPGRLRTTYDTVEGLAPVQVRVNAGVVVLTGEVSTQALKEQAARLARNVHGVAEVENRVVVAQDLEGRLTPALKTASVESGTALSAYCRFSS